MSDRSSGQSSFQTVNGGISLFLLTFIILCLVSFAALSIVSARADARLTESTASRQSIITAPGMKPRNSCRSWTAAPASPGPELMPAAVRRPEMMPAQELTARSPADSPLVRTWTSSSPCSQRACRMLQDLPPLGKTLPDLLPLPGRTAETIV